MTNLARALGIVGISMSGVLAGSLSAETPDSSVRELIATQVQQQISQLQQTQSSAQLVPQTPQAVFDAAVNTCKVAVPGPFGQVGWGSGVMLENGYVLTCAHVVPIGAKCRMTFHHAKGDPVATGVGAFHGRYDLALVKLDSPPAGVPGAKMAKHNPSIGDWVYHVGYPGQRTTALAKPSQVFQFGSEPGSGTADWVMSRAYYDSATPGDSGGPLFNAAGEVIGPTSGSDWVTHRKRSDSVCTGRVRAFIRRVLNCPPGQICPSPRGPGRGQRTPIPGEIVPQPGIAPQPDTVPSAPVPGPEGPPGPPGPPGPEGPPGQVNVDALIDAITARLGDRITRLEEKSNNYVTGDQVIDIITDIRKEIGDVTINVDKLDDDDIAKIVARLPGLPFTGQGGTSAIGFLGGKPVELNNALEK